jgi:hypothetical protein
MHRRVFVNRKVSILIIILGLALIGGLLAATVFRPKGEPQDVGASGSVREQSTAHETHTRPPARVPAFQAASETTKLGPTLAPDQFVGKAREAYRVAKQIPATLAQLPCYCECDRGFGHKSLHSCFEDDHASHCAVCVDEALLAYQLQTREKKTPAQVRQQIIETYSRAN